MFAILISLSYFLLSSRDISRGAETYPIQAVNEVDQQEFIMEFRYITRNCYAPDINVIATIQSMEVSILCIHTCLYNQNNLIFNIFF